MNSRTYIIVSTAAAGLTLLLSGCADEYFHNMNAIRQSRIDYYWNRAEAREDRCSGNLAELDAHADSVFDQHKSEYNRDLDFLKDAYRQEIDNWNKRDPERRAWFQENMQGDPDNIPTTFRDLFY